MLLSIHARAKIYCFVLFFVVSQSSGKSSVLESVVGKDFLPRGSGKLWHSYAWIYFFFFLILLVEYWQNSDANFMQGLLLEGHLSCSYIRARKEAENMQSFSTFQGKDSLILVYLFIFIEVFKYLDWFWYMKMPFMFSFYLLGSYKEIV